MPILTYFIAALYLKVKQLAELNVCWNSVFRRLFGFHRWESVRGCIGSLERLDFIHMCQLAKVKFYLKVVKSSNSVIHNMFWAYLGYNAGKDKLCTCIVNGRNVVFANIYDDFMAQQV